MIKRFMQVHGADCKLVGRTYDLRKAYRQLGVHTDHYRFSWIAAWSPAEGCVKLFRMKGLPFGGTASVASFLRVSRALKELGIRGGVLLWSSFFDDFICIARPEDAASAHMTVKFLFQTLGWVLSEDPEKDKGFNSTFTALGVEFDLTQTHAGVLRIGNTQKRRDELAVMVQGFLDADRLTCAESESLRSRLVFAEGQVFGWSAQLALRAVGSPVRSGLDCSPLSEEVLFGLRWMLDWIVHAPPREITTSSEPPLLLFIDGACEPAGDDGGGMRTSVGAILIDAQGHGMKFFGLHLPDEVVDHWGSGGRRQLVFEAEVLPYLLALTCWSKLLEKRHVLIFIDNDGARHSWIKGGADSIYAMRMIHKGTLLEARLEVQPYFCRVPLMVLRGWIFGCVLRLEPKSSKCQWRSFANVRLGHMRLMIRWGDGWMWHLKLPPPICGWKNVWPEILGGNDFSVCAVMSVFIFWCFGALTNMTVKLVQFV